MSKVPSKMEKKITKLITIQKILYRFFLQNIHRIYKLIFYKLIF